MDEPFGALDAITREDLQNELSRLWQQFKTTVVFVTHDVDEANFMMATPSIALVPLIIIWFGTEFQARVAITCLLGVWSILVNTSTGVKSTNKLLREVSRSYGLNDQQYLHWVAIPNAIPYIFAGLRIGLAKCIIGVMVAQMTMQLVGLGGLVITYGNQLKTEYLLAGVITSSVFGVIVAGSLAIIQTNFFPWIAGQTGMEKKVFVFRHYSQHVVIAVNRVWTSKPEWEF